MAKERLRLPARMKGGGIKRAADTGYPMFLGALLDILPRCVDRKESNGGITRGIYSDQLTEVMGEGAIDEEGHKNTQFLRATTIGPCLGEMQKAWEVLRNEAAEIYGFQEVFQEDEARGRLGPLAEPTPVGVRNRGAIERQKARRVEAFVAEGSRTAANTTRDEGERREEGDARQRQEEEEASS